MTRGTGPIASAASAAAEAPRPMAPTPFMRFMPLMPLPVAAPMPRSSRHTPSATNVPRARAAIPSRMPASRGAEARKACATRARSRGRRRPHPCTADVARAALTCPRNSGIPAPNCRNPPAVLAASLPPRRKPMPSQGAAARATAPPSRTPAPTSGTSDSTSSPPIAIALGTSPLRSATTIARKGIRSSSVSTAPSAYVWPRRPSRPRSISAPKARDSHSRMPSHGPDATFSTSTTKSPCPSAPPGRASAAASPNTSRRSRSSHAARDVCGGTTWRAPVSPAMKQRCFPAMETRNPRDGSLSPTSRYTVPRPMREVAARSRRRRLARDTVTVVAERSMAAWRACMPRRTASHCASSVDIRSRWPSKRRPNSASRDAGKAASTRAIWASSGVPPARVFILRRMGASSLSTWK